MSNYPHTVSLTTNYESRGLGGEYGKHLASVFMTNIYKIHILLYDLIDTNLSRLSTFLSNINSSLGCSLRKINKSVTIINTINGTHTKFRNILNSIKDQMIKLHPKFLELTEKFAYINLLKRDTEIIMSSCEDSSSLESKLIPLITSFSFSLSQFNTIESLIICIRSTIQEIYRAKEQFVNSINKTSETTNPGYFANIKSLSDNIDRLFSAISDIEFYTYCLKYWICKFVNSSNTNTLSITQCSKYVRYFYDLFPLHPKTFQQLFYTETLPSIKKFQSELSCFTSEISKITGSQINSLNQFILTLSRLESEIDCKIGNINSNIDYLLNFNCHVTKSVKSYLCDYIKSISSHYCSCYKSLKENIKTFECIQKCVETMLSELNQKGTGCGNGNNCEAGKRKRRGTGGGAGGGSVASCTENGSKQYVKDVFSSISCSENIKTGISVIDQDYPSKKITEINGQLCEFNSISESNGISKTTGKLAQIKNLLSCFRVYLSIYVSRIRGYLAPLLSKLTENETQIETGLKTCSNSAKLSCKYESIKHKVSWCKSSLEFEVRRVQSVSYNAKLVEKHLDPIIDILNKYNEALKKLEPFKKKLETLKDDKKKKIAHLKNISNLAIFYLRRLENISESLKCRIKCVSIMTIKNDIEYIKSEIESINNIVSYVQSELSSLGEVRFGIDCGTVNQVECCIKEIVCLIHKKYCCLSSITSQIKSIDECNKISTESLTGNCELTKISECACPQPSAQSPDSCKVCGTTQENHQCQCCETITQCLEKLISSAGSCEKNITQNLNWINKFINNLTSSNPVDSNTCPTSGQSVTCQSQPSSTCQEGVQAQLNTECKSQSNTSQLIQCVLEKIKQWQPTLTSCANNQVTQCENPPASSCQATDTSDTTTACSKTNQASNSSKLAEAKLCLDTIINKCCCQQFKDFINKNELGKAFKLFKCQIIFNFGELFCIYSGFDKSIVEYLLDCNHKLECMRCSITRILSIPGEISSQINFTKNEINKIPTLVNTMKLSITEMECAIEDVVKSPIRCSLKSLSNHLKTNNRCKTGLITNNPVILNYSILNVTNYKSVIDRLFQSSQKIDQIIKLIIWFDFCYCVLRLELLNINRIEFGIINFQDIIENLSNESRDNLKMLVKLDKIKKLSDYGTKENHFCLCMIVKYLLYPAIIKLTNITVVDMEMLSTMSRKFDKYSYSMSFRINLSKLLMVTIALIDKIIDWLKNNFHHDWIKYKSGDNVKCLCGYYQDPIYYSIVSITLFLSSLIKNIWATDNSSIVTAIQSLSNYYSELKSYDFTNIDIRPVRCNKVCGLLVEKKCGQPVPKNCCCWCVACYNLVLGCVYLCVQFRFYKAINKKENCEEWLKNFCDKLECTCPQTEKCCLLKLAISSQLCNRSADDICKELEKCCTECGADGCCQKIKEMLAAGGDLLVIGCNCECTTGETEEVKAQCVFFNNPWGGRSAAVLIACKCKEPGKCCCLNKIIEDLKGKLTKVCENCQCDELKKQLQQLCTDSSCCGEKCLCKELKDLLPKICENSGNCLCKKIDELANFCKTHTCPCKDKGCCRCVCCKLAIAGVKILTGACRQNFLEPYKRITIDLISSSINKVEIRRKILDSINNSRQKQTFLVKNNYSTHFNTYTDHKNIANSFPGPTIGYAYDTVYEHQTTGNSSYTGINGIREGYPKSRSGIIAIINKMKEKERINVYTLEYLHTRVKTGKNIRN